MTRLAAELQQEVENLALRLLYVNNAKDDVRSDISVMKRAAERADAEVSEAESRKQKQVRDENEAITPLLCIRSLFTVKLHGLFFYLGFVCKQTGRAGR